MTLKVNPALKQHFKPVKLPEATTAVTKPIETHPDFVTLTTGEVKQNLWERFKNFVYEASKNSDN